MAVAARAPVVLCCGCTDDTSRALAAAFAAAGCAVYAAAPRLAALAPLQEQGIAVLEIDPCDGGASMRAALAEVGAKTGRRRIDVLVLNAAPPGSVCASSSSACGPAAYVKKMTPCIIIFTCENALLVYIRFVFLILTVLPAYVATYARIREGTDYGSLLL